MFKVLRKDDLTSSKKEEKRINSILKQLYLLCGQNGRIKKLEAKAKALKEELKTILASFGIHDTSEYNEVKSPNEEYMSKFKFITRKGSIDMALVALKYPEQYQMFKTILEDEKVYKKGSSYLSFEFEALK